MKLPNLVIWYFRFWIMASDTKIINQQTQQDEFVGMPRSSSYSNLCKPRLQVTYSTAHISESAPIHLPKIKIPFCFNMIYNIQTFQHSESTTLCAFCGQNLIATKFGSSIIRVYLVMMTRFCLSRWQDRRFILFICHCCHFWSAVAFCVSHISWILE